MKNSINRRQFLGTTALAGAGAALAMNSTFAAAGKPAKPAILGGNKVRTGAFADWPIFDKTEEDALIEVLKSKKWFRGNGSKVAAFEKEYQAMTGAKHCIATSSGTTALLTALGGLGIGPGDEVIIPPYTFVATYNVVVLNYALPVFVDTDIESFQMDARKVEAAITPATKLIMPVHVGGSVADMDTILATAKKHNIPVLEDACQAHLAEWKGRVVGNWGLGGCNSFQASKNLTSGEGGAILTNDAQFAENCYNFHNQGRGRAVASFNFTYAGDRGSNYRLSEFQGGILLAQMARLAEQAKIREGNANYLNQMLPEIPGIIPSKLHAGCTRSAYHLYMFRYDKTAFAGMDRGKFIEAMGKEGIPCSGGYGTLNKDNYVKSLAKSPYYQKIYGKETMAKWEERNECPVNDKLCSEAVWFTQNMLIGPRSDMEQIVDAVRKIQAHAGDIVKA